MTPHDIKRAAARGLDVAGINRLGFALQKLAFRRYIRAVNYHVVRPEEAASFERHLEYFKKNYVNVDMERFTALVERGEWPYDKPGILLSFDDGHITHYEIAAPLLEKYGFTGWFFVPIGLMRLGTGPQEDPDGLTPTQLKYLANRHVVGSHTQTHCRLHASITPEQMEIEIARSRENLEREIGGPIDTFCWAGGEEENYSAEAARLIRENYKYSFMTNNAPITPHQDPFQIQRTNIESHDPLWLVKFQLSGLMDLLYTAKRRRVNALTK